MTHLFNEPHADRYLQKSSLACQALFIKLRSKLQQPGPNRSKSSDQCLIQICRPDGSKPRWTKFSNKDRRQIKSNMHCFLVINLSLCYPVYWHCKSLLWQNKRSDCKCWIPACKHHIYIICHPRPSFSQALKSKCSVNLFVHQHDGNTHSLPLNCLGPYTSFYTHAWAHPLTDTHTHLKGTFTSEASHKNVVVLFVAMWNPLSHTKLVPYAKWTPDTAGKTQQLTKR